MDKDKKKNLRRNSLLYFMGLSNPITSLGKILPKKESTRQIGKTAAWMFDPIGQLFEKGAEKVEDEIE